MDQGPLGAADLSRHGSVFCVIAGFTAINQTYDYYPTLARLLGKDAANFTDLPALQPRPPKDLPAHGSRDRRRLRDR